MENPENPKVAKTSTPKPRTKIAASSTKILADLIRKAEPDPDRPLHGIDAISAVEKVLRAALRRGVTISQIVEILREVGIDLRPSTIQTYLRILEQEHSDAPKKKAASTNGTPQGPASGTV
ncbi:hypothetical protein NX862_19155 [Rhodobacter sp. KR11]|uniref:hypothetical protein n=1 Tax=Rhodobacter sp. KR11 TaxID=2974588 RepID=UPI002221FFB6|nr:hypothetical protein [Rhodobacter sp. KR11]MCW1920880.1 hypothetical protein [Rhodobacter sp. KR11]